MRLSLAATGNSGPRRDGPHNRNQHGRSQEYGEVCTADPIKKAGHEPSDQQRAKQPGRDAEKSKRCCLAQKHVNRIRPVSYWQGSLRRSVEQSGDSLPRAEVRATQ